MKNKPSLNIDYFELFKPILLILIVGILLFIALN